MITIQSGMLIALGFLAACLLGLLVAPAFWSRAVRLTTRRIKDTMPLSELEIEADRDRIRAEYAIKMHKLESLVDQVKLAGARQQIEINRRDARVNMLESDLDRLQASYEEADNAKRVLEQTVTDRLPRVESRLSEAKQVLVAREREVNELTRTSEQQVRALAEASAENAERQREIERLTASVSLRGGRGIKGLLAGDNALKSELENLKTKTKEQAQLIARLQQLSAQPASGIAASVGNAGAVDAAAASGESVRALAQPTELEKQLRTLQGRSDDQTAEIARLKAAVAVFERDAELDGKGSIRESKIALKARVQSLEAQTTQQAETVSKLRSELASVNERLARQVEHYTSELKRLGSGAAIGQSGRSVVAAARASLADRVAQARTPNPDSGSERSEPVAPLSSDPSSAKPDEAVPAVGESAAKKSDPKRGGAAASTEARPRLLDRLAGLSRTP